MKEKKKISTYSRIFKEDEDVKNSNYIIKLLEILSQIRLLHWQTFGFAQHTAFGNFYDSFSDFTDRLVESSFGNDGRKTSVGSIQLFDYEESKSVDYIREISVYLRQLRGEFSSNTELQNIIDEMTSETNKLKYLLTLK